MIVLKGWVIMYNTDIKERFTKSYTEKISVRATCRQFFDIAQRYEEQWGADLCTKTPEELCTFLEEASGLTAQSQVSTLTLLKAYVKWCMEQDDIFGVCEDILKIKDITSDKFKYQTVTSPTHLQKYLDDVFAPEEYKTVDNLFRTYFWLAYAGISHNDVVKIRKQDFDFSEMVVRYNGKVYPIYRDGIKAIRYCVELDYMQSDHPNSNNLRIIKRIQSDFIMRGRRSVFTIQTLRERTSRKQREALNNNKTNMKLSYFKVWISGLFYRAYIDEISGIKPDFLPFITEINQAKGTKNRVCDIRKQARFYYKDYLSWKDSFNK